MNGQVLKYAKSVYQLEKGLPPNGVVPVLKAKVEEMKDKVRMVAKKNHWKKVKLSCFCPKTTSQDAHDTVADWLMRLGSVKDGTNKDGF